MTGRVCPVHGEYAPTGICRWCEPEPKRMPTNLPPGSTPCRCGEYSWEPSCPADMREGVIAGMFHSPAQCFKLNAAPPAVDAYADLLGPPPKPLPPSYDWTRGPDVDNPDKLARIANVDVAPPLDGKAVRKAMDEAWCNLVARSLTAVEAPFTEAFIDAETHAAEESRLLAQHAALRWERVARRWEAKHLYTLLDVAKQWQTKWRFELKQALKILERHNPLLQDAPWKEPKP